MGPRPRQPRSVVEWLNERFAELPMPIPEIERAAERQAMRIYADHPEMDYWRLLPHIHRTGRPGGVLTAELFGALNGWMAHLRGERAA